MDGVHQTGILWKASHLANAATFLILFATGVLLFSPTIRSRVVGGYSLYLRLIHCGTGVAFALGTLPFVPHAFRLARRGSAHVAGSPEGRLLHWRRAHLLFTLGAGAAFTLTGLLLWQQGRFALVLADASATVHLWLTYVAAGVLAAHFSVVAIAPRALRERAGVATPPLHA
jgi:hypothetical protein